MTQLYVNVELKSTNRNMILFYLIMIIFTNFDFGGTAKLTSALKMAQCRAHCLNKFGDLQSTEDNKICKEKSNCFMCWQTCEKLTTDFPIWSYNCGHETRCNEGCESACQFLSTHKDTVVPLSPYKSRLTLIFGGTSAQWSLIWGNGVPTQKAVFALFTRSTGRPWKLRLQTAEYGALLQDVLTGTELKLVAVAESGLLSVIITPFDPPSLHRKGLGAEGSQEEYPWNKDNEVLGDQDKGWPLLYQASVQESGLVAAKVWWSTQRPFGSDYLVTWEVAAGGLKGHLYTDLPEVDLKLWPKTIYKVQVEVVSGPLGEPRVSQLLILDTNNITAAVQSLSPKKDLVLRSRVVEPMRDHFQPEDIIVGVLAALVVVGVVAMFICRRRSSSGSTFTDTSSSNSKLTLNRSVSDLTVDENLVRNKSALMPSRVPGADNPSTTTVYSVVPYPSSMGPQNTLGIPNTQNQFINIPSTALRSNLKADISVI